MHLVAVDLTTGSMAFCVSKEKSIPAVCNIFDSIMHLQKALRSLREKSWKNNLLFASPSIRRPTMDVLMHDYQISIFICTALTAWGFMVAVDVAVFQFYPCYCTFPILPGIK